MIESSVNFWPFRSKELGVDAVLHGTAKFDLALNFGVVVLSIILLIQWEVRAISEALVHSISGGRVLHSVTPSVLFRIFGLLVSTNFG